MTDSLISLLVAVLIIGLAALLFWPERGLIPRWRRARWMSKRVLSEDALKHIHNWEMSGRQPTLESIAGTLSISLNETAVLLEYVQAQNLLHVEQGEIHLTPDGRQVALHLIRAHRLWEQHLAEETGYAATEWHELAEEREHYLTLVEIEALDSRLGRPTHDPHGDPIPTADGEMVVHGGRPLTVISLDTPGKIVHLEDEPELVYAQLVAEGLQPGMTVHVVESNPQRVRFWANGDEHTLAPLIAANISVVPLQTQSDPAVDEHESLSNLAAGETAEVVMLAPACRGAERRRFMDLGILPGTQITAEMRSPSGDPVAYRIRGAVIALREEQAKHIRVRKLETPVVGD